MDLRVAPTVDAAAELVAELLAGAVHAAVAERGHATLALSGGGTPRPAFAALRRLGLPWGHVTVVQVDERMVPPGDPARNLAMQQAVLPDAVFLPLPVDTADHPAAAADHLAELERLAGSPPVLDVVQLGLGDDGHTASWPPGRSVPDTGVAAVGRFHGHERMTLTESLVNRSRRVVWMIVGAAKAPMLARLLAGDRSIPAGRVDRRRAVVVADPAACPGHETG